MHHYVLSNIQYLLFVYHGYFSGIGLYMYMYLIAMETFFINSVFFINYIYTYTIYLYRVTPYHKTYSISPCIMCMIG